MKKKVFHDMKENVKSKILTAGASCGAVLMTTLPAKATSFSAYSGTSSTSIMNGVITLLGTIGTYGGGLYGAAAVFTLVLALRNEDNEGRNKALLNLMAAIGLLAMGVILKLFFSTGK